MHVSSLTARSKATGMSARPVEVSVDQEQQQRKSEEAGEEYGSGNGRRRLQPQSAQVVVARADGDEKMLPPDMPSASARDGQESEGAPAVQNARHGTDIWLMTAAMSRQNGPAQGLGAGLEEAPRPSMLRRRHQPFETDNASHCEEGGDKRLSMSSATKGDNIFNEEAPTAFLRPADRSELQRLRVKAMKALYVWQAVREEKVRIPTVL